jgi:hypothetical protein
VSTAGDVNAEARSTRTSQVETMMKHVTRSGVIQVWFAAVVLIVVVCLAFGVSITITTGAVLLIMSLVPPAVLLLLWPGIQPPTIGDVLRGSEQRDYKRTR